MFRPAARVKKNRQDKSGLIEKLAIIDLGTNSVRFDVYDVNADLSVERVLRHKEMVRLGDEVFETGSLSEEAMERTALVFDEFARMIEEQEVDRIVAFATSALRTASNTSRFVRMIKKGTGIPLRVITGKQEAELIAKGILSNETLPAAFMALIDIGGGSTEVSIVHKKTSFAHFSFPLGANRLQQNYLKSIPPVQSEGIANPTEALRQCVRHTTQPLVKSNNWPPIKNVMGSSGTVRALAKVLKKNGKSGEPFKLKDLNQLIDEMATMSREELLEVPGLEENRADLILAGALVLSEVMATLGANRAYATGFSLRDGILEDEIEQIVKQRLKP